MRWRFAKSQPSPEIPVAIISGTDEPTDYTFGRYIHSVHPDKNKYPGTVQFFGLEQVKPGPDLAGERPGAQPNYEQWRI